jgi:hypothetical protein
MTSAVLADSGLRQRLRDARETGRADLLAVLLVQNVPVAQALLAALLDSGGHDRPAMAAAALLEADRGPERARRLTSHGSPGLEAAGSIGRRR